VVAPQTELVAHNDWGCFQVLSAYQAVENKGLMYGVGPEASAFPAASGTGFGFRFKLLRL